MDSVMYAHTFIRQYYNKNNNFSVGRTHPSSVALTNNLIFRTAFFKIPLGLKYLYCNSYVTSCFTNFFFQNSINLSKMSQRPPDVSHSQRKRSPNLLV